MKQKYLALSAILVGTLSAFSTWAGIPDEDFTVDLTRESFMDGTLPAEKDLYINFSWVCGTYRTQFNTMSGTTGIVLNEVFFVKRDDQIVNRSFYFPNSEPFKATDRELTSIATLEQNGVPVFYAVRKNHDGILIERAIKVSPEQTTLDAYVPSIAFPGFHAVTYSYCLPYDTKTQAPKVMNSPWGDVWSNH